jgi:CRP/FNR family transcriptional regulator, anaerobic regulatory protein
MEQLIALLKLFSPLSPELEKHLRGIIKEYNYSRKQLLLEAGQVCHFIMYVESGLTRSFSLKQGKQVTNWFMEEGNIIISVVSFLRKIAAKESVEALEACRCWGILHAELQETYRLFPEFDHHARLILEEYYCRSEERHESQQMQTPDDKYAYMMATQPSLILRVTREQLSSYLNFSVSTLAGCKRRYPQTANKKQPPKKRP